ncbi:MAG: glycosyltransferase [Candidatus Caldarchaeales archaeon]
MRVHVGVCGIGFGHAARAKAVIEDLARRGDEVVATSYAEGLSYLRSRGINVVGVQRVDYGRSPDGGVSVRWSLIRGTALPLRVAMQVVQEMAVMDAFGAEVVLSETRGSTVLAAKAMGLPVAVLLNQFRVVVRSERHRTASSLTNAFADVVARVWSLADEVLIADYPPPLTISRRNLFFREVEQDKVAYVGPVLDRYPSELPGRREAKEALGFSPDEPLVLVLNTGPESERRALRERLIRSLDALSEYQLVFSLGELGSDRRERRGRHLLVSWLPDENVAIAAADVVISRAGHSTVSKALAFGCRLVLVPTPNHSEQLGNAESLSERGAAVVLDLVELSPETLREAVRRALDLEFNTIRRYAELAAERNGRGEVVGRLRALRGA